MKVLDDKGNEWQGYELFDDFLETCIKGDGSLLTKDESEIFTLENMNKTYDYFCNSYEKSKETYDKKFKEKFKGADSNIKVVYAHFNWLWSLIAVETNIGVNTKKSIIVDLGIDRSINKKFFIKGISSTGQSYTTKKYKIISSLINLFKEIKKNINSIKIDDIEEQLKTLKDQVIKNCLFAMNQKEVVEENGNSDSWIIDKINIKRKEILNIDDGLKHAGSVLLHLSKPDAYESIVTKGHKKSIVGTFGSLINEQNQKDVESENESKDLFTDEFRLKKIRDKISELSKKSNFNFYDPQYKLLWDFSGSVEGFSVLQALEYKQAVILYGPPGTSKTYDANNLAQSLIFKAKLKIYKDELNKNKKNTNNEWIREYFETGTLKEFTKEDNDDKHIHHLQLHANYSYEDFIVGMQIENNTTKPKDGFLLNLINKIDKIKNDDQKFPHILILDEINRVDLSRLFGEVFSCMENRKKPITIPIGGEERTLEIPDNLYFIGTMNEIDFSLERIDFALRRRFCWFFHGFDREKLKEIIKFKEELSENEELNQDDINTFTKRAEELNKKITTIDELGKEYAIGHTFFAEIVDIYNEWKKSNNKNKQSLYNNRIAKEPVKILWTISIKPMIEAFLGNLDKAQKDNEIKELEKIFLGDEKNGEKKQID